MALLHSILPYTKYGIFNWFSDPVLINNRTFADVELIKQIWLLNLTGDAAFLDRFLANSANDSNNETVANDFSFGNLILKVKWTTFFFSFLILLTIAGNLVVIRAFFVESALQTLTNYWVISLSLTDIFLAILVMPIAALVDITDGVWVFLPILCDVFITVDITLCTCSIYHLFLIGLDRYLCVRFPFTYPKRRTKKSTILAICFAWVLSTAISAPRLVVAEKAMRFNGCSLTTKSYQIASSVVSFYVPFLATTALYIAIYNITRRQRKKFQNKTRDKGARYEDNPPRCSSTPQFASSFLLEPQLAGNQKGNLQEMQMLALDESIDSGLGSDNVKRCKSTPPQLGQGSGLVMMLGLPLGLSKPVASRTQSETGGHRGTDANAINSSVGLRGLFGRAFRQTNETKSHMEKLKQKQEQRTMRTVVIVLGVFIICWTPFFLANVIEPLCEECAVDKVTWSLIIWLGYANSATNPFLYAFFNAAFRRGILRTLRCK